MIQDWFGREQFALAIALLGTFSIASRSEAEEVLRDPLVIERVVRGGLAVVALMVVAPVLLQRINSYSRGRRAMAGLLAYLTVALVSTLYSAAPLVTAAKVGELTAGLAPVIAIALGPRPGERLRNTLILVMALVGSLLAIAVVGFVALPSTFKILQSRPGFFMEETLVAPFFHSNTLSALGATVGVFAIARLMTGRQPNQRWWWMGVAAAGLISIVLASGRQGVVMALAGIAVVLWSRRRVLFLGLLAPAALFAGYAYRDSLFDIFARERPQSVTNFSGRLYWWEAAFDAWTAHPWTGWGYGAGGRFVALASIGRGTTSNVHSGYVEALVGVGILGLAGLLYALFEVVVWSIRNLRVETAFAALIVPLALRTGVSQGFGGWLSVEFVLFALLVAITDQSRIERRHSQQAGKGFASLSRG
ncbi:MAG: O-antigen ligase family protein [Actinomycetota bacterium]